MQRSSENIGTIATALAKSPAELTNPEKSLVATIRTDVPGGGVERSAVHRPGPPFSARHQITLADPRPVYWRARFIAAGSRTTGVSHTQRYTPQLRPGRLVMAATSCAQLMSPLLSTK